MKAITDYGNRGNAKYSKLAIYRDRRSEGEAVRGGEWS